MCSGLLTFCLIVDAGLMLKSLETPAIEGSCTLKRMLSPITQSAML